MHPRKGGVSLAQRSWKSRQTPTRRGGRRGNTVLEWNRDLRQQKNAQRAFKLPVPHQVAFAETSGVCETLEGPVPYEKGDAIMTGLIGEHWPILQKYFLKTYEAIPPTLMGSDGEYRKKKIVIWVMVLQEETSVRLSSGAVLSGKPGDWLVQYEPGSIGIVESGIFAKTYKLLDL